MGRSFSKAMAPSSCVAPSPQSLVQERSLLSGLQLGLVLLSVVISGVNGAPGVP